MKSKLPLYVLSAAAVVGLASSCTFTSTVTGANPSPSPSSSGVSNPVIQALSVNPTNVANKTSVMTFTVSTFAPDGSPLTYTWSATKGTLSTTTGQPVNWTPQNSDGSLSTGLATIQVLVSNGKGGTAQGAVNILINSDGSAAKQ